MGVCRSQCGPLHYSQSRECYAATLHYRCLTRYICLYKLLRLHRPFLLHGYRDKDSDYAYSTQQCISSATTVCEALDAMVDANRLDAFWYMMGQALGAATCIFSRHSDRSAQESR